MRIQWGNLSPGEGEFSCALDCLRRFFWGARQSETDGQDARATILPGALPSPIRSAQPASSVWWVDTRPVLAVPLRVGTIRAPFDTRCYDVR